MILTYHVIDHASCKSLRFRVISNVFYAWRPISPSVTYDGCFQLLVLYYPVRVAIGGLNIWVHRSVCDYCVYVVQKHGCLQSHRSKSATKYLCFASLFLRKTPTKLSEPCVECNGHAFLIASSPIRTLR